MKGLVNIQALSLLGYISMIFSLFFMFSIEGELWLKLLVVSIWGTSFIMGLCAGLVIENKRMRKKQK